MKPPVVPASERRFAPAAQLQSSGELSKKQILAFTKEATKMLLDDTSLAMLEAASTPQAAGSLSVQWQRQLLEHHGIEMDFGCRMLGMTPQRFGGDSEVMDAFKAFQQACGASMQKARKDKDQPPSMAKLSMAERRFNPAAQLQSSGELSKKQILTFTTECARMLLSDESINMLVQAGAQGGQQAIGQLSVMWQRQLLEHHGIEAEFGCHALGETATRFGSDKDVMKKFMAFQTACQKAMQKAAAKLA